VLTRGFLMQVSIVPGIRKTLQSRRFQLTWEKVEPGPA